MTKKDQELLWRLKELPTGREVAELVEQKVITVAEAREILFTEKQHVVAKEPVRIKQLEDEIAFLRKTVDLLASTRAGGWVTVQHQLQRFAPVYPSSPVWTVYNTALSKASAMNTVSTGALPVLSSIN